MDVVSSAEAFGRLHCLTKLVDQLLLVANRGRAPFPLTAEALDRAIDIIEGERPSVDPEGLDAELSAVRAELLRLAAAVAAGGELPALVDAMRARDARREQLERDLSAARHPVSIFNRAALRRSLRAKLRDWHAQLTSTPEIGQRALRALISGRLVFTPEEDADGAFYRFEGEGTIAPIIGSLSTELRRNVASPRRSDRLQTPIDRWIAA